MALYIYRDGWSFPIRCRNSNKFCVKIQLLTRITQRKLVWPPSSTGLTSPFGVQSSRSHNSLIRTPNRTFYICILIVSTRATQWWVKFIFWQNHPDQSDQFAYANFDRQHILATKFYPLSVWLQQRKHHIWEPSSHWYLRRKCMNSVLKSMGSRLPKTRNSYIRWAACFFGVVCFFLV